MAIALLRIAGCDPSYRRLWPRIDRTNAPDVWRTADCWYLERSIDQGAGLLVVTASTDASGAPTSPLRCFVADGRGDQLVLRPVTT
jgi:hypothetical protein